MTETARERRLRLAGPDYYPAWHPVVLGRRALRLYVLRVMPVTISGQRKWRAIRRIVRGQSVAYRMEFGKSAVSGIDLRPAVLIECKVAR